MQVTNIKAMNAEGTIYSAKVGDTEWSCIYAGSEHWHRVQKAIEDGAEVTTFPVPTRNDILLKMDLAVDAKTKSLILGGFSHDGETFSSSEAAQANFVMIENAISRGSVGFPLPRPWDTLDGGQYSIPDEETWKALLDAKDTHIFFTQKAMGSTLKAQFRELTVEELSAWSDPR